MKIRRTTTILLILASLCLSSIAIAGTLPATFFGMHINHSSTAWPSVAFGSYRLWDDGSSWALINTSKGVYNWAPLDAWVAKAEQHNVELTYTFGRTPNWASSSPSTSCDYGSGQCVAPADYTNWDSYVTAIATRYKGKIKYYEMWNEPNDTGFWKGTTAQLVEMTRRASGIIHSVDPNALVVSPGATWTSTTAWAWLDGYLTAGAGPYLDEIGFHGYTGNNNAETILTIIDNIQKTETAHGLSLPLDITEGGWGLNTVITNQDTQAAFLVQRYLLITSRPAVKSFFWYQWDNSTWGTLWDTANGIHTPGIAYGQLTSWLIGATANGCTKASNSTWTCSYTLANGNTGLAVWNATASVGYTPGSQYTQVSSLDGTSNAVNGNSSYTVGNKPVLFTSITAPVPTAALSVTPNTGVASLPVSASVSAGVAAGLTVKSVSISFDDGTTVNTSSGTHTFASAGTYNVVATVTDSLNRTATSSQVVTVTGAQPPTALLSVSPATGKAPLSVNASSAASTDTDSTIASSAIDFGDGTVANSSTAVHTYTVPGTYAVKATVKDNRGLSSTATVNVTALANQSPIAKLTLTQSANTVTASTAGSVDPDGKIVVTLINWGDGSTTSATSGSHTYTAPGTYTVTATVTDNNGAKTSTSQSATITTNKPPVAVITLTQTAGVGYKVSTAGSYDPDGTIASTVINWGDGTTTAATSGAHTYAKAGTYKVIATVTDKLGASTSASTTATPNWGIFMVSPKSGATTPIIVHFVGSAASQHGISSTKILADGKTVYSGTSWMINTNVTLSSGTRKIVVQATDKSGVLYQSAFTLNVD
jgi:PKD repeat protein